MRSRSSAPLAIAALFAASLSPAAIGTARAEESSPPAFTTSLVDGVIAALEKRRAPAIADLERAATIAPDTPGVAEALGTAALLLGDLPRARRVLARSPKMAAYLAMAQIEGPGGLSRANTALSTHVRELGDRAEPNALFLAALAFASAGQSDKAHEILSRALSRAPSALDEAFAPDPGVGMVRAAIEALEASGAEPKGARVRLGVALLDSGRRAEALRVAESCLAKPEHKAAGLRLAILVENAVEARRTLDRVDRVLADTPDAEDAKAARVLLLLRTGQNDRARRAIEEIGPIEDPIHRAAIERARAELAISTDPVAAVDLAEAAVRDDPRSDEGVGTLVRALLAAKKIDRAEAFAGALLKREPKSVDPFALLGQVASAKGQTARAEQMQLRSRAFVAQKKKLEAQVQEREEVIRQIRDAEGGMGVAGLEALRGEHPHLWLAIDLALARRGAVGFARVARERILAGCAPKLRSFLERRRTWDVVKVGVAPYGSVESHEAPLSAADPARCSAAQQGSFRR